MVYGHKDESHFLIYEAHVDWKEGVRVERKHPTVTTLKGLNIGGICGDLNPQELLLEGLRKVENEMKPGYIHPFLSKDYPMDETWIYFDRRTLQVNNLLRFPLGPPKQFFMMYAMDVYDVLQDMHGKKTVNAAPLFEPRVHTPNAPQ